MPFLFTFFSIYLLLFLLEAPHGLLMTHTWELSLLGAEFEYGPLLALSRKPRAGANLVLWQRAYRCPNTMG